MRCTPCTVRAPAVRRTSSNARLRDSRGAGRTWQRTDRNRCSAGCRCRAAVPTCSASAARAAARPTHPGLQTCRCSWPGLNPSARWATESKSTGSPRLRCRRCLSIDGGAHRGADAVAVVEAGVIGHPSTPKVRCSNVSKLPSSAKTSTETTTADLGPCRDHATIRSTASGAPATMASTDPSRRFRTQPQRPNRWACSTMARR